MKVKPAALPGACTRRFRPTSPVSTIPGTPRFTAYERLLQLAVSGGHGPMPASHSGKKRRVWPYQTTCPRLLGFKIQEVA